MTESGYGRLLLNRNTHYSFRLSHFFFRSPFWVPEFSWVSNLTLISPAISSLWVVSSKSHNQLLLLQPTWSLLQLTFYSLSVCFRYFTTHAAIDSSHFIYSCDFPFTLQKHTALKAKEPWRDRAKSAELRRLCWSTDLWIITVNGATGLLGFVEFAVTFLAS